jgi:cytidine deaminase
MSSLSIEVKKQLVEDSINVRKNAYAPYSQFKVGAAILAGDGKSLILIFFYKKFTLVAMLKIFLMA